MTLTPKQAALLRDVVAAIIDSGYAELPRTRRGHVSRIAQIDVLAHDKRILSASYSSDMTDYIMGTYNVNRNVASIMLSRARRQHRAIGRTTGRESDAQERMR